MQKYVGQTVTGDQSGAFSKRQIWILAVNNGKIKAYYYTSGVPRVFIAERIMVAPPVAHVL